jgi:hypothetical protein
MNTAEDENRGRRARLFLWFLLGATIILSPIGLFATSPAWGEWGGEELKDSLGFVPEGLDRLSTLWKAPLSEYGVPGVDANVGYVLSALIGVILVVAVTWLLGKALARRQENG